MPTSTLVATATFTVAPTASPLVPDGGASSVDRLATELRALRLQAQNTEAELAKLQQQAPARSPAEALRGADAGMVAGSIGLALGVLALVWWRRHRRAARPAGARAAAAVESSFPPQAPVIRPAGPMPTVGAAVTPAMPRRPSGPPVVVAGDAASQSSRPLVLDSAFRPSSLDVTFVDHDALDSSMMPVSAVRQGHAFAAPDINLEFDPEAAASEVERVRSSLAAKRSERSRLSAPSFERASPEEDTDAELDSVLQSDHLFASSSSVPIEVTGVDVLLDFPDPDDPVNPTPPDTSVRPGADPNEPHEQGARPEREIDVSVSLIQELRGLGLWSEARELAKEVVNSAQAPLDVSIASSLHQVQHGTPASGGERRKKERG